MPKIIENVREQLLTEAKRQLAERGYAQTTIRSVAGACGLGIGTVYNYFKSKDMLIATFLLEDWQKVLIGIREQDIRDAEHLFHTIYLALKGFGDKYRALFSDEAASKAALPAFGARHKLLRDQISDLILPIAKSRFQADFLAESLLTWTMTETPWKSLSDILLKIIK